MNIDTTEIDINVAQEKKPVICYYCNNKGHLKKDCRKLEADQQKGENKSPNAEVRAAMLKEDKVEKEASPDPDSLMAHISKLETEDRNDLLNCLFDPRTEESLDCLGAIIHLRATTVNTTYARGAKAFHIDFKLLTVPQGTEGRALLDSGASENLIDKETWKTLKTGALTLTKPIAVHNLDGTENKQGKITQYCWLRIKRGDEEQRMRFFITDTGEDHFVLGYPFLSAFNPQVDWSKRQISGPTTNVLTVEFKRAQKQLRKVQLRAIRTCTRRPKTGEAIYYRRVMTTQDTHSWRERKATTKELLEKYHGVLYEERQPPQKSTRNASHSRTHGVINCKLYPLNKEEEDRVRRFVKEEQRKGYIYPETTPAKERQIITNCRKANTFIIRNNKAMTCRNARLPMDKEISKPDGNWRHRNTRTTRKDQCKITTGIYTPPMMRPRSTGIPLHQKKLEPYQSNPKWVRNEEGRYEKARTPNVTNVDTTDVKVSTTETIRPKTCCWFCNSKEHVKEDCQKFKALKNSEKSTLPQKTRIRVITNQRNKEEKEVSKSTRTTKTRTRRSKKKTPYKQTQECTDALDKLAGITNKLTLAQTDKSPEPETDALPHANAISSQKDYWETNYWETMTQEYPEGREIDQNDDLVATEHDYAKKLASFYKGLCELLGEEQTTSPSQFIALGTNVQDPQIDIMHDDYIETTVLLPYEAIIKVPETAAFSKGYALSPDKVSSKAIIGKNACLDLSLLEKLCKQLKKEQVKLLAHRQTDRRAEETNQSVETALRVFD